MKSMSDHGYTLLELMAVAAIMAIVATMGSPMLEQQLARREVETIARRFIQHAQFARQAALFGVAGQSIQMIPREGDWNRGWDVMPREDLHQANVGHLTPLLLLSQGALDPVEIERRGSGFAGLPGEQKRLEYAPSGAAKTQSGGFVANRLIFRHSRIQGIERHAILGSGGRWRLCYPRQDRQACR